MNRMKYIIIIFMYLSLVGCGYKAIPMTKDEVLEITEGRIFKPKYVAKRSTVWYKCSRLNQEEKDIFNELWIKGTYGAYELYNNKSYIHVEVKHALHNTSKYYFEDREWCINFVKIPGVNNSVDVYIK